MTAFLRSLLKNPILAIAVLAAASNFSAEQHAIENQLQANIITPVQARLKPSRFGGFFGSKSSGDLDELETKLFHCAQQCIPPEQFPSTVLKLTTKGPKVDGMDKREYWWRELIEEHSWTGFAKMDKSRFKKVAEKLLSEGRGSDENARPANCQVQQVAPFVSPDAAVAPDALPIDQYLAECETVKMMYKRGEDEDALEKAKQVKKSILQAPKIAGTSSISADLISALQTMETIIVQIENSIERKKAEAAEAALKLQAQKGAEERLKEQMREQQEKMAQQEQQLREQQEEYERQLAEMQAKQEEEREQARLAQEEAKRVAEEEAAAEKAAAEAKRVAEEEAAAEAKRVAEEEAAAEAQRVAEEEAAVQRAKEEAAEEAKQVADELAAAEEAVAAREAAEADLLARAEESSVSTFLRKTVLRNRAKAQVKELQAAQKFPGNYKKSAIYSSVMDNLEEVKDVAQIQRWIDIPAERNNLKLNITRQVKQAAVGWESVGVSEAARIAHRQFLEGLDVYEAVNLAVENFIDEQLNKRGLKQ